MSTQLFDKAGVVDRACIGDWRGYAVHRLNRRSCASAAKTIAQDGVPKCCRDLFFLA
jgi:hypothetical protein